jgi:hypothetical protein
MIGGFYISILLVAILHRWLIRKSLGLLSLAMERLIGLPQSGEVKQQQKDPHFKN